MEGMSWKTLLQPEYVMTFLEGFLLLFMTAVAGGNALDASSATEIAKWPNGPTWFASIGFGMLNGIRALRNLRAPAPRIGHEERRRSPDVVTAAVVVPPPVQPGG